MSKAAIGAKVQYCGHAGWFIADIFHFNGINVVRANKKDCPVSPGSIIRDRLGEATHHLSDCPKAGFWCPDRGVFVVPEDQVIEIADGIKPKRMPKKCQRNRLGHD